VAGRVAADAGGDLDRVDHRSGGPGHPYPVGLANPDLGQVARRHGSHLGDKGPGVASRLRGHVTLH
jgi:hypothetical protein